MALDFEDCQTIPVPPLDCSETRVRRPSCHLASFWVPRIMCFRAVPSTRTEGRKIRELRGGRKQGFLGKSQGIPTAFGGAC